MIRIRVHFAGGASSILLLVVSLLVALISNAFVLLWTWIGVVLASKALSGFCPNVSISSGHIALDAVPGIGIWVEVFFAILASSILLQDLVLNALIGDTFRVVSVWLGVESAGNAVTHVVTDLSGKVAVILLASSAGVIRSST